MAGQDTGGLIPWRNVWNHVARYNPHTGSRDAFRGMAHPAIFNWHEEVIQPDDPRIDRDNLRPISKRDVKRYMIAYQNGSDFPAVVLTLNTSPEESKFRVQDGAHRLQSVLNLSVPINAYVGTLRSM